MLIPLHGLLNKYNLTLNGVIQVGSHYCEEHDDFLNCGVKRFVYIEPCKEAFEKMWEVLAIKKHPAYRSYGIAERTEYNRRILHGDKTINMFNCACGAEEAETAMYVSHQNQGQSNSLLEPKLHLHQHPEVVFDDAEVVQVVPLDNLPIEKEKYGLLVMDVQGFEGEVLKGATETLKHINIIYTEVNRGQTYLGNMEIDEMDLFLAEHGFNRVETFWPSPNWTWGDAVFIKKTLIK